MHNLNVIHLQDRNVNWERNNNNAVITDLNNSLDSMLPNELSFNSISWPQYSRISFTDETPSRKTPEGLFETAVSVLHVDQRLAWKFASEFVTKVINTDVVMDSGLVCIIFVIIVSKHNMSVGKKLRIPSVKRCSNKRMLDVFQEIWSQDIERILVYQRRPQTCIRAPIGTKARTPGRHLRYGGKSWHRLDHT